MAIKSSPGGYPDRRVADVPSVAADAMRDIQRSAQEDYGLDLLQLIENGGRAVAQIALGMLGGQGRMQRVVILAGGGNKGATGLSAARQLTNWGLAVEVVFAEVEAEMSFAAQRQVRILRESGVLQAAGAAYSEITLEEHLARADLVVDALVGYGLVGPPMGMAAAVTDLAMAAARPVLAVDVPTGVNATTGEPAPLCVRAMTTVMLDLPKRGLLQPQARPLAGELYLADLGIPRAVYESFGIRVGDLFHHGPLVHLRR